MVEGTDEEAIRQFAEQVAVILRKHLGVKG
jgi:hypothetical protein